MCTALTSVPVWISAAPSGQESLGSLPLLPARAGLVGGQDLGCFTSAPKLFSVTGISVLTRLSPEILPVLASISSTVSILEEGVSVSALLQPVKYLGAAGSSAAPPLA